MIATEDLARAHRITVRVEEELRAERALAEWYATNSPDQVLKMRDDLIAEHRARLELLERLAAS